MERRTFLRTTSALCSAGLFGLSMHANANEKTISGDDKTERMSIAKLRDLNIAFPTMIAVTPTGETIEVQRKPRIIRRYAQHIYVYFEQSKEISVFSLAGERTGKLPLTDNLQAIKDFAIDTQLQSLYVIEYGHHQITVLDFYGQKVGDIGEFGIELLQDLNGPKSITVDERGKVHVLTGNDNIIRVYSANGAYVSSYNHIRRSSSKLRQLDGCKMITGVGGKFNDSVTVLSGY
ncbi:NHL repeat-containing protein [Pseudoalteromonas aurantia]|uniref:Uncharacterized protein n=1 Tax=Pseudoalteromonas aurantia 208 TaxID=1314867 RepID=A0ABR9EHF7_9GAMM|nr:hypothetical protein [Pseudoalteromonas aurantia]MBE0370396.1 hypothetical protein [Pseudoalteromonas aurantia 208]